MQYPVVNWKIKVWIRYSITHSAMAQCKNSFHWISSIYTRAHYRLTYIRGSINMYSAFIIAVHTLVKWHYLLTLIRRVCLWRLQLLVSTWTSGYLIHLSYSTYCGLPMPLNDINLGQNCLTASSLYLNWCWLIIQGVLWHSSEHSFARSAHARTVMHVGIATRGEENVPGIPGACVTRNFVHLARGP